MSNFRVIVSGNSGDGFSYRIEDVLPNPSTVWVKEQLFLHHSPGLCVASTVEDLKRKLDEMRQACDLPVLAVKQDDPKLIEASPFLQKRECA